MPVMLGKVSKSIQTFKNIENRDFCAVFEVFEGLDRFRDLPQHRRRQAKLPKALPRPKKVTKTLKTQNPEKPPEGDSP